jgi:hypothetical protein
VEGAGSCALTTFAISIPSLFGEVYVGIRPASSSNLNGWVNEHGSYGYGSNGILGSEEGYVSNWSDKWQSGDIITVVLDASRGIVAFAKNGGPSKVAFTGVAASDIAGAVPAVWMHETGASAVWATGSGALPRSCMTATPAPKPYVVTTKYPSGAVAITTLGRTRPRADGGYTNPPASVSQQTGMGVHMAMATATATATRSVGVGVGVGVREGGQERAAASIDTGIYTGNLTTRSGLSSLRLPPIGIFGVFGDLTLTFEEGTLARVQRVYAQDLRGDTAEDLTKLVVVDASTDKLTIPGSVISRVGTAAKSDETELSEPGMVMVLELSSSVGGS